jgi:two-component system sensor histidine kinase KdpD
MTRTRGHGELRIYLGAAPGVGKTYAMLGEARRRVERGTDVVVGLVETHDRRRTLSMLDGLEVLPRRTVTHRGVEFTELDTDAVLARRPRVVVVDELAHTNAPGSVREKRWQDIDVLLAAGIDVLSTVNVQHLESLNDVVERITGVRQRETVPDEVVRRAGQVELVDITPEALRRRMAHGNIYPARKIDAALANYFRPGNLTALRELALLWVADQVDVALRRYRADQNITDTWEARERVVVSVTGGPESETLVRRARRIAHRAGADLLVVHVLRGDGLVDVSPHALSGVRTLAEALGAGFHTVVGEDVPTALLDFARGVNATQLVIGTSRRSRLARLFDEGIGAAVVQDSGPIDVHMVTHDEAARAIRFAQLRGHLSPRRRAIGWALAVLLPGLCSMFGLLLPDQFTASTDVLGYLLVTVVVALVGGLGPALTAAVLGALALNYFFTPPLYSLDVAAYQSLITLVVMLLVALLVALVVDRAARRSEQAVRARTEAALLAAYAHTVLTHPEPVHSLIEQIQRNFTLTSVSLLVRQGDGWQLVAGAGAHPASTVEEADTAVSITEDVTLALSGRTLTAADRRVVETAATQALLALRQQRLTSDAADAQRRADATELRTALLSAVGHDLRTPLTSIKASIGSLRDPELSLSDQDTEDLLATIEESTDRLTTLVGNLLDSSRLATGAVRPLLRPVGYYEVVARAMRTLDERRLVTVDVDERLPMVRADVGLLERVVANVIDNALRHARPDGPPGEPFVAVRAGAHAGHVELRVVDHGPGLPKDTADQAFAPFQRFTDRTGTGIGLGLSVAKGFIEAMSGTIGAEDTPGGGLTIVLRLPQVSDASTGIDPATEQP